MAEFFKPESLSVMELFCDSKAYYRIPVYQRPYKWEDEQVDKLWSDIVEAWENDEEHYFLGSIITSTSDDEQSTYFNVVDGQQRLTTLVILFAVIRDLYPGINENADEDDLSAIKIDIIEDAISKRSSRLKLVTHGNHRSDFDELILKKGATKNLKKPKKYEIRRDEEPKYKFVNSALIFREKILKLGEDKFAQLVNFIFNNVYIIRINCVSTEFAIKMFQVLNDRGMDLTASDLIKSFLIEKLYKKYKGNNEEIEIKLEQFLQDWRTMEQVSVSSEINLNDLFVIYEYYRLAENPKKSLYDELKEIFVDEDPNEAIADLKNFADSYKNDIYESENTVLYSFWYLRWSVYWKSILLAAKREDYNSYDELKVALRRFYYLYWIAGKTLSQIKQTSFNLIAKIKAGKEINEIIDALNSKLEDDKIVSLAISNLSSSNITSEAWCKPLLALCEYENDDKSKKVPFIELNKNLHLEHIMPRQFSTVNDWKHITTEVATKWLESCANITLLSGEKNIVAKNYGFQTKMSVYTGKGKHDEKDDKVTAFNITKSVVDDFKTSKYGKEWNEAALIGRWKWFFEQVATLLSIDVKEVLKEHDPKDL